MNTVLRQLGIIGFLVKVYLMFFVIGLSSCAHRIEFHELDYSIAVDEYNQGVIVVIDKNTLDSVVSIRSFATGIAHSWDARPGVMLKQVADIEFPQMFKKYQHFESFDRPPMEEESLFLALTIPDYQFKNFHAYFTVKLTAYNDEKSILLEKLYAEEGGGQGGKMVWAGAFGMKSAVRQSSLTALKKIFDQIRVDLKTLLEPVNTQLPVFEEDELLFIPPN